MPCDGCGSRFNDGECVLVRLDLTRTAEDRLRYGAKYHYIPREICEGIIYLDCFQRSLAEISEDYLVGAYFRGQIRILPETSFFLDHSGVEVRARFREDIIT